MTEAIILSNLSIPNSGCGNISFQFDGLQLKARYEVRSEGVDKVGTIKFTGVWAFRFQAERVMSEYVDGSYDALIHIAKSPWIAEAIRDEKTRRSTKHFAVFFSSNGYLEVLAEAATEDELAVGVLSE